ncbi:Neurensin-1 [Sarcoptes scabiei]|nr:Neurensin-1 [Sarcoptes scabiei]
MDPFGKKRKSSEERSKRKKPKTNSLINRVDDDCLDGMIDEEKSRTNFIGIKSYLHNFYENVPYRNPNDFDELSENDLTSLKSNNRSRIWIFILITGSMLMLLGGMMILIGFTLNRMKIDIGYQEEMRIINKTAYDYNKYLDEMKIIGLILFTIGGVIVASTLLLPSLLPNKDEDDSGAQEESTHLKLNVETKPIDKDDRHDDDDDGEMEQDCCKNLIPIVEKLSTVQPKHEATAAVVTNSGLRQIDLG